MMRFVSGFTYKEHNHPSYNGLWPEHPGMAVFEVHSMKSNKFQSKMLLAIALLTVIALLTASVIDDGLDGSPESSIYKFKVGDLTYQVSPDDATQVVVLSADEKLNTVSIPESVAFGGVTYKVTAIGDSAFEASSIKELTIGNSVKSIGNKAFNNCSNLTSVTIPDSVTMIGNEAFARCNLLASVTIGDSVKTIGDSAFEFCKKLESVTVPASVTSIGNEAFKYCEVLTSFNVDPNNGTYSSADGFLYSKDGRTLICCPVEPTESLTIPDTVTTIVDYAFKDCDDLTAVHIPVSVTYIGKEAFYGCNYLRTVDLNPETPSGSATTIGESAFAGCGELRNLTLSDYVTSIGDGAFSGSALTTVNIPASVTSIGEGVFDGCTGLTSLTVNEANSAFEMSGKVLLSKDKTTLVFSLVDHYDTYSVPDTVTTIYGDAFSDCKLTSVVIPDSVTTIGNYAFSGCSRLTTVTLGNGVEAISQGMFFSCKELTSLTIPNSVTTIGKEAFQNCGKLASLTIPNSVTTIGEGAFKYCSGLTEINIPGSVTSIGKGAFDGCTGLTNLTVDDSSSTYSLNNGALLSKNGEIMYFCLVRPDGEYTIPGTVTTIGEGAFEGCYDLTSVIIPDSVVTIGKNAFIRCSSLYSVTFGSNVETIGEGAFSECYGLSSVVIPNSSPFP